MIIPTQRECRADVYEDEGFMVVEVDLPGVAAEDIRLQVGSHLVSIRAAVAAEAQRQYHRRERGIHRIVREVPLPLAVRRDTTLASLRDGVLTVRIRCKLEVAGADAAWQIPVRGCAA